MDIATIPGPLLRIIEGVSAWQNPVISKTLAAPPGSPALGDRYLIAATPTGAWSGRAGSIAEYVGGLSPWAFVAPFAGMSTYVIADGKIWRYNGAAWGVDASGGALPDPTSFTDPSASFVAGILVIAHNLGRRQVRVDVWDQNDFAANAVATPVDANTATVDLTAYQLDTSGDFSVAGVLIGTWKYRAY